MVCPPAAVVLAEVPSIPQAMELPPAREFLTSAGFGGVLALLAALVLAVIILRRGWQRERHHEQWRAEKERAADLARCEQRFRWVVETAGIEPATSENATLGLGPEVALELLSGLHRDAKRLDDETLVKAIGVYLNQFALVLAQQGGSLSHLNADPGGESGDKSRSVAKPAARGAASHRAATEPAAPTAEQITASTPKAEAAAPKAPASASGRRRRP